MSDAPYYVVEEPYIMEMGHELVLFTHSIKRADGSHVFRAASKRSAERILERLLGHFSAVPA